MKVRDLAIIACACAADLSDYDGYAVIPDATIPGDATGPAGVKLATAIAQEPVGVITTPADGSVDNLGVATLGCGGTVRVKLGGAVTFGQKITLMADGTFEGDGEGTVCGKALEAGAVDELVEATLFYSPAVAAA